MLHKELQPGVEHQAVAQLLHITQVFLYVFFSEVSRACLLRASSRRSCWATSAPKNRQLLRETSRIRVYESRKNEYTRLFSFLALCGAAFLSASRRSSSRRQCGVPAGKSGAARGSRRERSAYNGKGKRAVCQMKPAAV